MLSSTFQPTKHRKSPRKDKKEKSKMRKLIDLTGQRFGRFVVLERAENTKGGLTRWTCICDCGVTKVVTGSGLGRSTMSCGCLRKEMAAAIVRANLPRLKHGHRSGIGKSSPTYGSWGVQCVSAALTQTQQGTEVTEARTLQLPCVTAGKTLLKISSRI